MNESLRDRLRRLRREGPAAPAGAPPLDASSPAGTTPVAFAAPGAPGAPATRAASAAVTATDGAAIPASSAADAGVAAPASTAANAGVTGPAVRAALEAPDPGMPDRVRGTRASGVVVEDGAGASSKPGEGAPGFPRASAASAGDTRTAAAPRSDAQGEPVPATGSLDLRRRLERRGALLALTGAGGPSAAPLELPRRVDVGPPERLVPSRGGALARISAFARAHAHGGRALESGLAFDRALLAASARDTRFADIDLERAVYLDTETTGLAGGAGTYVFLVGLGTFTAGGFEVWQGFLDDPRNERALLRETAERIADASAIVSFFGKSFDRHRLEDKMRIHGVAPPFAATPHLDLYWPLRRAHQGRFENCRLKTLERELAGVTRDDDLPGSFAPAAWFDFLQGRPHRLEGVFRHNLEDVLSLVALLPHAAAAPVARN